MIEYILICSLFGVAAAFIAHAKARSAVGWFFTGFLLGPFGLIVAALPPALMAGRTRACPQCFEVIRYTASVCWHCRSQTSY